MAKGRGDYQGCVIMVAASFQSHMIGGLCKVMELAGGGSASNKDTPSSFQDI